MSKTTKFQDKVESYERNRAEREAKQAQVTAYREQLKESNNHRAQKQAFADRLARNTREALYERLDEELNWLLENNNQHPDWDKRVAEYHNIEARLYAKNSHQKSFSGIDEVRIVSTRV